MLRRLVHAVVLASGLACSLPAQAAVTLSQGQSALFNFDFSGFGAVGTPPYPDIFVAFNQGPSFSPPGDQIKGTFFSGPGGSGTELHSCSGGITTCGDDDDPEINDGVFSMLITATAGSFSVAPSALSDGNDEYRVDGVLVRTDGGNGSVPEPGTLALLGLGLAGLAAARRRKR